MGVPTSSGSSSEEDENWKAAIKSIASTTVFGLQASGTVSNGSKSRAVALEAEHGGENGQNAQKVKHYQIKAQKLLDQILEKTLMVVKDSNDDTAVTTGAATNDEGVRLFKNSSAGIVFDHKDEIQRPTKRPRILPGLDIDQNSRKFRRKLQSIAVDSTGIIAAARIESQKALARLEAKEEERKAKAKKEEERVSELKKIRGERWLPSIAKEMQRAGQS